MQSKPHVLIIYGPTGVGKTDFALQIASQIPAEIVNMDVGQMYAPLTIGTAKPDLNSVTVPHHCFDLLNTPEHFTVTAYRALCETVIQDIWKRGKVPILVGGSGFYLKSLFFPPQQIDSVDSLVDSAELIENSENNSEDNVDSAHLWQQLYDIDPDRAEKINIKDTYRIKRALTIWRTTGKKPSECKPQFDPISDAHIVFLTRDRKELYDRINQRVDQMMDEGWLEETKALLNTPWEQFIQHKKLIGYNELVDFLRTPELVTDKQSALYNHTKGTVISTDINTVLTGIKQRTRHYAKRQCTFWRMFADMCAGEQQDADATHCASLWLDTVNLTLQPIHLYSNQLYIKQLAQALMVYKNNKL
ncbi:MAG: tRNA (adenosine(37)-N6)-dimethylallyltransferase MiaA [Candidatus Dependentiae bacterium]|nr:tRNA (adenosine(37)-N6)-dimethylallyltransferase MiaA [Candidatus Dependentiae bacterium]